MTAKDYSLVGISATILFWSTYFIMSSLRTEYSHFTKAISELGTTDAPDKWIWNVLGYIFPGLMIALFSIGLFQGIKVEVKGQWPLYGIMLSGVFMAMSGIFPADMEDRSSLTTIMHTIGSFGSYLFFLIGGFAYPRIMRRSGYWRSSATILLIFVWCTIVFGSWYFIFPQMPGIGQRIIFSFYFGWIFYAAVKLRGCENWRVTVD